MGCKPQSTEFTAIHRRDDLTSARLRRYSQGRLLAKATTMNLMDWDATKFDVLVPKMNEQHHKLVNIMNKLYERAETHAPKAELDKLIVELRDYTVLHFREEEQLLEKMKFPKLAQHKLIHAQLLTDFGNHYTNFSAGSGQLSPEFFKFLRLWLTSHIMHIDRKYGEYAQQQH